MDAATDPLDLYPSLKPYAHGMLDVGDGHSLYWEQSGNPDGEPIIVLHGGPGAGTSSVHRRFFDPSRYCIILLDQRGAGDSTPYAETDANTTDHLIDDLEALRGHLELDRWILFGGSWGSTLAIAYGIRHPDRCAGFILRGIFLGGAVEVDWFLYGMKRVFPEAWENFADHIDVADRGDLLTAYSTLLDDPDPSIHLPAAQSWCRYESACSSIKSDITGRTEKPAKTLSSGGGNVYVAMARIEAHYFRHGFFFEPDELTHGIDAIADIPAVIVQGRFDMICPIVTADRLAAKWPKSRYVIVPDAGHSAMEPGIRRALVLAANDFPPTLNRP